MDPDIEDRRERANDYDYRHLIRLVRVARALEAHGYYNAAKLLWAVLFSEETRASNLQGLPIPIDQLDREMDAVIDDLKRMGVGPELITALQHGKQAALEDRTIALTEIPQVHVCRTCGHIFLGQIPERCATCGARALTFREFIPYYFLEPLTVQQALLALASTANELEQLIRGLTEEQMTRSPGPGEWSIHDVLSHLLVAQNIFAGRVDKILWEHNPPLKGVAAWAIGSEGSLSTREILERFRTSRQETLDKLRELTLQGWLRPAQHEEFGQVTLLQQASYFAKHDRYHMPQIEAIRKAIEKA
jgi:uncharacterized damage-inducible protein DinB